jgi:hypothetical protein
MRFLTFRIPLMDPWCEMNTPIMKEHSAYQYGKEHVRCTFEDPALEYEKTIKEFVRMGAVHSQRMQNANSFNAQRIYSQWMAKSADPSESYSLLNPYEDSLLNVLITCMADPSFAISSLRGKL